VEKKEEDISKLVCQVLLEGKLLFPNWDSISTKTVCFDCRQMPEPLEQKRRNHFGTYPALLSE